MKWDIGKEDERIGFLRVSYLIQRADFRKAL